jgi:hypothetical protein
LKVLLVLVQKSSPKKAAVEATTEEVELKKREAS